MHWAASSTGTSERIFDERQSGFQCGRVGPSPSAPVMASLLVVAASPSGPVGLVQESTAAGKVIMQSAGTAQTPLLKTLSEDVMQTMSIPKPPPGATPAQVQEAAAEILRRTSSPLTTKATPPRKPAKSRPGWQRWRTRPQRQPKRAASSVSEAPPSPIRKRLRWRCSIPLWAWAWFNSAAPRPFVILFDRRKYAPSSCRRCCFRRRLCCSCPGCRCRTLAGRLSQWTDRVYPFRARLSLRYSVDFHGKRLIDESELGLDLQGRPPLGPGWRLVT